MSLPTASSSDPAHTAQAELMRAMLTDRRALIEMEQRRIERRIERNHDKYSAQYLRDLRKTLRELRADQQELNRMIANLNERFPQHRT